MGRNRMESICVPIWRMRVCWTSLVPMCLSPRDRALACDEGNHRTDKGEYNIKSSFRVGTVAHTRNASVAKRYICRQDLLRPPCVHSIVVPVRRSKCCFSFERMSADSFSISNDLLGQTGSSTYLSFSLRGPECFQYRSLWPLTELVHGKVHDCAEIPKPPV